MNSHTSLPCAHPFLYLSHVLIIDEHPPQKIKALATKPSLHLTTFSFQCVRTKSCINLPILATWRTLFFPWAARCSFLWLLHCPTLYDKVRKIDGNCCKEKNCQYLDWKSDRSTQWIPNNVTAVNYSRPFRSVGPVSSPFLPSPGLDCASPWVAGKYRPQPLLAQVSTCPLEKIHYVATDWYHRPRGI